MRKRSFVTCAMVLASGVGMLAQGQSNTSKGTLPNGKPFQQIQSQITAVDQQVQALQTKITSIESNLQSQINSIYGSLSNLQGQVNAIQTQANTVGDAITALQKRVADNETAMAAYSQAISDLQSALTDTRNAIASTAGDVSSLQLQATNLQTIIDADESQLTSLEQANAQMNTFLGNMTSATCQSGQAMKSVSSTGIVQCTSTSTGGAGNLSITTVTAWAYLNPGTISNLTLSCPAGYSLTGSGFWIPSGVEYVQQVTDVGYRLEGNIAYPVPYFASRKYNPVLVTSKTLNATASMLAVQYQPNGSGFVQTFGGYANCARVQ